MKQLIINGELQEHITNLEWADDLESVANTINFTSDDQFNIGSTFTLMDNNIEVMSGIISDYTQNEPDRFSYAGYDFGFYLNKNSIIKQFNGVKISDAFKQLCKDFNIPVGTIPEMTTTIKKIYKNVVLADVFKEFLDLIESKAGVDYFYFTCIDGKFNIKKYELIENLQGYVGDVFSISSIDTIQSPSVSVTMEDLKNRVIVTDNASDKITKRVTLSDANSISKYGLLQHIEEVDTDNKINFNQIAKNKLAELNKLKITVDLSMLGDYRMRKGVVMPVNNERLQIDGDFLIKSSRHSISDNKEIVTVNLERYDRSKLK